jgi:hypothetical protein
MKDALIIAAGAIVGLLLAGVIAPELIVILPPRLRGVGVVWAATAALVVLAASAFWLLWARPRRNE